MFLNLLRRNVKRKLFIRCKKRCLCRSFVRKFHKALFYVVCLAFHCLMSRGCYYRLAFYCWLLINNQCALITVPLINTPAVKR